MKINMYSVRDQKGNTYTTPFLQHTDAEAQRYVHSLVNFDKQSFVAKYPQDYDLYILGQIDLTTGKLEPLESPKHLIAAVQLKDSENMQ